MKVMKFGGTSLGTQESLKQVLQIVAQAHESGEQPVVVLSAMGGVTNLLNQLAEDASTGKDISPGIQTIEARHFDVVRALIPIRAQNPVITQIRLMINELESILQGVARLGELSARSRDAILSFGERLAAFMTSKVAEQVLPSFLPVYVDARELIKTNSQFGQAQVQEEVTRTLIRDFAARLPAGKVCFVTGFIGSDLEGRTTTLGRGGSDYTGALFGAALDAEVIEIWTDVDGMLTADPRIVKKSFPLRELSYSEAMELSYFGAKVIYPPTMGPAVRQKIPILIRNTFRPEFAGTAIRHDADGSDAPIRGISSIQDISLINLAGSGMVGRAGFSGRLFSLLAREQINVILITQSSSEHSITFAVQPQQAARTRELLESEFELELSAHKLVQPEIEHGLSVLAIVGENMKNTPGMSGRLFHALGKNGINVRAIAQGSSELNISVIVSKRDLAKALNAVHDAFFAALNKTIHVFCAGTGNIGTALIEQLRKQYDSLLRYNDLEIKVVGICNTRRMLLDDQGINLADWKESLTTRGEPADTDRFIESMETMNLPNCIFIDNTASQQLTDHYPRIFRANISIVTSNKIANSGTFEQYQLLKDTARRHGVDFLYETNVGAGLPIVRVLKDLLLSGDRIIRVEAILSGTISFIFNNFQGNAAFHEVVKQAQSLGYTEPDPRDDLNGKDFLRKMLIIGRDAGYAIREEDVELEQLMPVRCLEASSVDRFYEALAAEAPYFEQLKTKAQAEGNVLRYIGRLQDGQIDIRLVSVGPDHPFYHLSGSDNIISFTTERYRDRPLVVKGPGAGAAVTAAGVFADLVNAGTRRY